MDLKCNTPNVLTFEISMFLKSMNSFFQATFELKQSIIFGKNLQIFIYSVLLQAVLGNNIIEVLAN
jgi:hypothetical protein